MNKENQPLVIDELVESENLVEVSRIQINYQALHKNLNNKPQINKGQSKIPTSNWLDLKTLDLNHLCPKF